MIPLFSTSGSKSKLTLKEVDDYAKLLVVLLFLDMGTICRKYEQ